MGVVVLAVYLLGLLFFASLITAWMRSSDESLLNGPGADEKVLSVAMAFVAAMLWPLVVPGWFVWGLSKRLTSTAAKVEQFTNPPLDPERQTALDAARRELEQR